MDLTTKLDQARRVNLVCREIKRIAARLDNPKDEGNTEAYLEEFKKLYDGLVPILNPLFSVTIDENGKTSELKSLPFQEESSEVYDSPFVELKELYTESPVVIQRNAVVGIRSNTEGPSPITEVDTYSSHVYRVCGTVREVRDLIEFGEVLREEATEIITDHVFEPKEGDSSLCGVSVTNNSTGCCNRTREEHQFVGDGYKKLITDHKFQPGSDGRCIKSLGTPGFCNATKEEHANNQE